MQTETSSLPSTDAQAVHAVQQGDVERYRELVERHEDRVYALAWSRLGDPSLAEEVTQETFIRAFQHLPMLGEGAKFGGWISRIARNVAINFGLRHRRELNKRERWALESVDDATTPDDTTEICPPETLRQTLSKLPVAHRECLVLFYFENKSSAEAATTLGITEAAFRVRLHRARAALREQLETHLGESLEKIRPAKSLAPAIMAVIIGSSRAEAAGAGLGFKLLPVAAKILPFKWLLSSVWLLSIVPLMAFSWWRGCIERRNYRGTDGFRSRLHKDMFRSSLVAIPVMGLIGGLYGGLFGYAMGHWHGFNRNYFFIVLFSLSLLRQLRLLSFNRSRFQIANVVFGFVIVLGQFAVALGLMSFNIFMGIISIVSIIRYRFSGYRPFTLRMDYNLLLRASQKMLPTQDTVVTSTHPTRLTPSDLRHFSRFLGERWLVNNYRWDEEGLTMRLPSVRTAFLEMMSVSWLPMNQRCSRITLGWNGIVTASCGQKDQQTLLAMFGQTASQITQLEQQVSQAVTQSWQSFRQGNVIHAENSLGQVPDAEVFIVPTAASPAARLRKWIIATVITCFLISEGIKHYQATHPLKPVSLPSTQNQSSSITNR